MRHSIMGMIHGSLVIRNVYLVMQYVYLFINFTLQTTIRTMDSFLSLNGIISFLSSHQMQVVTTTCLLYLLYCRLL